MAKELQKLSDCKIYAVATVDENAKKFLETQTLVNFEKIWYFPDHIFDKDKLPTIDYLEKIEKKYQINLWKIASSDRRFYPEFNKFHKFTKNEILLLLEQGCKFFDSIVEEVTPDFLMLKGSYAYNDVLLYEMCKSKKIRILTLYTTRVGYRYIISEKVDMMDEISNKIHYENNFSTFEELQEYLSKFNMFRIVNEMQTEYKIPKKARIKALIKFLFFNTNFENQYVNYGKTKWRVLARGTARSHHWKKRKNENFLNKNSIRNIGDQSNYVFYPLHMEPERSLMVNSPYFPDQIEVIRKIAKSVPMGYKILVKDHPIMKLVGWRPKDFYKEILDIPNAVLVHPSITPEEIYKKCSLVITINGTSALEANIFGKPSIIFGDVDFKEIPSIIKLDNITELPLLIRRALDTTVNPKEVGIYLTKLEKNSFQLDLEGMTRDFLSKFYYPGYLETPRYPAKKMKKYFEDYKETFKVITHEHIKKMEQHKQKNESEYQNPAMN